MINNLLAAGPDAAPFISGFFLLFAPFAFIRGRRKMQRRYKRQSLSAIKALHWRQFEQLVADTYRRQGYQVREGDSGADGGIDLTLYKGKEVVLVQCKQWKSRKVGVSIVREMFGILAASNASQFVIVTSGEFTQQARDFASGKPVTLINGAQLTRIVSKTRASTTACEAPLCPRCKQTLTTRKTTRHRHHTTTVLRCSAYPKCSYTLATR
ncbi:restriction endonuclease [Salinimonas lutimaris]|uniref:restriction endonuclease n=1 Tax=Salinimonas lutimaris TaxID=914153 RepID=UPI0015863BD1|nr:restriction endonuclease [Salinimonas lutimaris]